MTRWEKVLTFLGAALIGLAWVAIAIEVFS